VHLLWPLTCTLAVSQFDLVNISRTVNADWYGMAPQSPEELAAKTLLHSGNMRGACQTLDGRVVEPCIPCLLWH
jgi:hypothetical protein